MIGAKTFSRLCRLLLQANLLFAAITVVAHSAAAQFVGNTEIRPFVIGFEPVFGPGGAVGGVSIDARGVLSRRANDQTRRLEQARVQAMKPVAGPFGRASQLRKVSLRGIESALAAHIEHGKTPLPEEILFLGGIQRIRYVFVYPKQRDIVLAGFAEGWKLDDAGNVVGQTTGQPVLRLDDLLVALRSAEAAAGGDGITCSIDPTEAGLTRFQRLLRARGQRMTPALVAQMERALGPQQITVTGVPSSSHFAQVLVAADFSMKQLAMNLEPAPINGLPSYMQLLQASTTRAPRSAMPRWWLALNYEPLLTDGAHLAWELRGPGAKVLTEEGLLTSGRVVETGRAHPVADQWARNMTEHFADLAAAQPVFAQLRNCTDTAVVAALILKKNLAAKAGLDMKLLLDSSQVQPATYAVPKTVDSRASLIRKGRNWIVSVSGGVDVDSWAILDRVEQDTSLTNVRSDAMPPSKETWWWE